ncbi:SGNH/GDSL hydrolase family protein [Streptomyces syringium]|uniref:SGNH/GDSL hydrolase family protein n=1 Tax=Streptomyces syringium TaxID=76729 RepID=UPI003D95043C
MGSGEDTPTRPVRIMPLGDSITEGWGSATWAGYREELFNELHRLGHDIDFVGPRNDVLQPEGDPDHAGSSGITIQGLTEVVPAWVSAAAPDWVLLHIGTNNMYDDNATLAPGYLRALLDAIQQACPAAHILLASIIPSRFAPFQKHIDEYNQHVRKIAEERADQGVHFVDMAPALTASESGQDDDLSDNVHPNLQGYAKMSKVWRDALHPLLPAPEGGPILTRNPHFQTTRLSAAHQADRGWDRGYFPGWDNEGVNAYAAELAGSGNGSNAVGMFTAPPMYKGISTRLATTPQVPVRVTFRTKSNSLGPAYACDPNAASDHTFTIEAGGHPPATMTADGSWRTLTYEFTPTGTSTTLRFSPNSQPGCGPLITDVLAREVTT